MQMRQPGQTEKNVVTLAFCAIPELAIKGFWNVAEALL
jgi:hypothetical protein